MKSRFSAPTRILISLVSIFLFCVSLGAVDKPKTASLKGKVFRSDNNERIPNALIILLDEKESDKHANSLEARTDDQGNYNFASVPAGKYTVSIRAWYKTSEEAPCQLLMAKTADKNSSVLVARDKDGFMQQVFIKGFAIKAGKELVKDFDFACTSFFEK